MICSTNWRNISKQTSSTRRWPQLTWENGTVVLVLQLSKFENWKQKLLEIWEHYDDIDGGKRQHIIFFYYLQSIWFTLYSRHDNIIQLNTASPRALTRGFLLTEKWYPSQTCLRGIFLDQNRTTDETNCIIGHDIERRTTMSWRMNDFWWKYMICWYDGKRNGLRKSYHRGRISKCFKIRLSDCSSYCTGFVRQK